MRTEKLSTLFVLYSLVSCCVDFGLTTCMLLIVPFSLPSSLHMSQMSSRGLKYLELGCLLGNPQRFVGFEPKSPTCIAVVYSKLSTLWNFDLGPDTHGFCRELVL